MDIRHMQVYVDDMIATEENNNFIILEWLGENALYCHHILVDYYYGNFTNIRIVHGDSSYLLSADLTASFNRYLQENAFNFPPFGSDIELFDYPDGNIRENKNLIHSFLQCLLQISLEESAVFFGIRSLVKTIEVEYLKEFSGKQDGWVFDQVSQLNFLDEDGNRIDAEKGNENYKTYLDDLVKWEGMSMSNIGVTDLEFHFQPLFEWDAIFYDEIEFNFKGMTIKLIGIEEDRY